MTTRPIYFLHFLQNFLAKGLESRVLPQFSSLPMKCTSVRTRTRTQPKDLEIGGSEENQGSTRVPVGSDPRKWRKWPASLQHIAGFVVAPTEAPGAML